jgi:hypothetical protein
MTIPRVPLATEEELADFLAKPKGTLRNWRYRGIGPRWHRLEGGDVRYRWDDVEEWLGHQAQGGRLD